MAAAAKEVVDELGNLTECPICMETMSVPKVLPCLHSFCLKCLTKYVTNKTAESCDVCPVCRKTFTIPWGGISGLPGNFFMMKMTELHGKASSVRRETSFCLDNVCESCSENQALIMYCVECKQKLCEQCISAHKKMKVMMSHQLLELRCSTDNRIREMTHAKKPKINCEHHSEEPICIFCSSCRMLICTLCFAVDHTTHQCQEISNVWQLNKQIRSILENDFKTSLDFVCQLKKKSEVLEKNKTIFVCHVDAMEKAVKGCADALCARIDSHQKKLLDEIANIKEISLKTFENSSHAIVNDATNMQCCHALAKGLLDGIVKTDGVGLYKSLHERIEYLNLAPDSLPDFTFQHPQFLPLTRAQQLIEEEPNLLGIISLADSGKYTSHVNL